MSARGADQSRRPEGVEWLLVGAAVAWAGILLAGPLLAMVAGAFAGGAGEFLRQVTNPDARHALQLTLGIAVAATIVNTTSLGMGGDAVPIDLAAAPARALVADIVYGAEPTPFVAAARRFGLTAVDGLGMLLHQAAPGFEAWFGLRPQVDDELRAAVLAP